MSKYMPERMSDTMSKSMPERMSDKMSKSMPERMPERMSDRMSDRMSEKHAINPSRWYVRNYIRILLQGGSKKSTFWSET